MLQCGSRLIFRSEAAIQTPGCERLLRNSVGCRIPRGKGLMVAFLLQYPSTANCCKSMLLISGLGRYVPVCHACWQLIIGSPSSSEGLSLIRQVLAFRAAMIAQCSQSMEDIEQGLCQKTCYQSVRSQLHRGKSGTV